MTSAPLTYLDELLMSKIITNGRVIFFIGLCLSSNNERPRAYSQSTNDVPISDEESKPYIVKKEDNIISYGKKKAKNNYIFRTRLPFKKRNISTIDYSPNFERFQDSYNFIENKSNTIRSFCKKVHILNCKPKYNLSLNYNNFIKTNEKRCYKLPPLDVRRNQQRNTNFNQFKKRHKININLRKSDL